MGFLDLFRGDFAFGTRTESDWDTATVRSFRIGAPPLFRRFAGLLGKAAKPLICHHDH